MRLMRDVLIFALAAVILRKEKLQAAVNSNSWDLAPLCGMYCVSPPDDGREGEIACGSNKWGKYIAALWRKGFLRKCGQGRWYSIDKARFGSF